MVYVYENIHFFFSFYVLAPLKYPKSLSFSTTLETASSASFFSMASLLKFGHFGTHFDCMGKTFPLENCERNGVAFDVHMVRGREVSPDDIDLAKVQADQRCADAD